MDSQDIPVLGVAEVVALERKIADQGTPLSELMKRAGRSVSQHITDAHIAPAQAVIFCGSGNNGGDGWVIADDLAQAGWQITLVCSCAPENIHAEPAKSVVLTIHEQLHPNIQLLIAPSLHEIDKALRDAVVAVDAMLGTGFEGDRVREPYRSWIHAITFEKSVNPALYIVAVDVPSGLSAQTGIASTPCITADVTVTMIVYKPGLLTAKGHAHCGQIVCAKIADIAGLL